MLSHLLRIPAFIVLCFVSGQVIAQSPIYKGTGGTIRFDSDAPLEVISATSSELKGAINLSDGTFAFTVDNRSFKGFNSPLQQEHFYENYIEADKFPRSTFIGKIIEPLQAEMNGTFNVRAKGILDIHGVQQERILPSTLALDKDRGVIKAEFTVMLRDHNIEIPRVVNQKIAEAIMVSVELEMINKADEE